MHTKLAFAIIFAASAATAADQSGKALYSSTSGQPDFNSIEGLLVDYSAASVSAADLASVGGDAVKVVENVRDFNVALKSLETSNATFGLSVTPARTSFGGRMVSLAEYQKEGNWGARALASTTLSYAQGKSPVAGVDFLRRAASVETSLFLNPSEDPVIAVATARCAAIALEALPPAPPVPSSSATNGAPPPSAPNTMSDTDLATATAAYDACAKKVLKKLEDHWNTSKVSISLAAGRIRKADGSGDEYSLGRTVAAGIMYGFDQIPALNNAALTVVLRHSSGEPVLTSLLSGSPAYQDSSLVAARLSGGSSVFRGLVEASNAKSSSVTTTQTVFKHAVGIDWRIHEGWWLALRSGKRQKTDGSGQESASFASLSYSPSPTLGH